MRTTATWRAAKAALAGATLIPCFGIAFASVPEAVDAIRSVAPEGKGNVEAAAGWNELAGLDASRIPDILHAMEGANPLAVNWLRSAVEVIADRSIRAGEGLPTADLGRLLSDTREEGRARQQAFDLIARVEPEAAHALVPGFLGDPNPALRRLAVARLMEEAGETLASGREGGAAVLYRQALGAARDVDQIEQIADVLTKELGREVDLPEHFGFLMRWKVIGPFDNTGRAGFDTPYPPEREIDLDAEYEGKDSKVRWTDFVTADDFGMVDVNKTYTPLKEVTAYAFTEFESDGARPAELRLGCKNAWKIWFNGEYVFGRDEYHRGMRVDQYKLPVQLEPGRNTILVKLCQNEQEQQWTVEWQFQLRVCDATGTAILSMGRGPTPRPDEATGAPQRRRRPAD